MLREIKAQTPCLERTHKNRGFSSRGEKKPKIGPEYDGEKESVANRCRNRGLEEGVMLKA